jgi:hypothetical protein
MRGVVILLALLAAVPASAAPLAMAEDQPVRFDNLPGTQSHLRHQIFHDSNETAAPRNNMSDEIASQLGVEHGTMPLFHSRVDSESDRGATLDGGIDGSGFKLKLSW